MSVGAAGDDGVMVVQPDRPPKVVLFRWARGGDRPNTDLAERIGPYPAPRPAEVIR